MSHLTNNFNLPAPYVRAVSRETYERGGCDYSVTELISPPRLNQLVKRHDAEITEDASDRLWVLLGTVSHEILERGGREGTELSEKRLYASVGGKRVGGGLDTLDLASGVLTDYKVTSVWSYIFGKPEWETQLNAYAFLARENGHTVTKLQIFAMFRDWAPSKARQDETYPQIPCLTIPVPLWEKGRAEAFLEERVKAHEAAKKAPDDSLPQCSAEDRWAKPTTWAVMKPGRKTALSVHTSEEAAWKAVVVGQTVEVRPGKSPRCESYCAAAPFCNQWKEDPTNPNKLVKETEA